MAGVYEQISSLVKRIREINRNSDDEVVLTLLEQLGTFSVNSTFRSLLLQSDSPLSLMKIFIARSENSPEIAKIVAKCLMNLTFGSFSNKLKVVKKEEFMESMKKALNTPDKTVCLQLTRLIGNLAFDETKHVAAPLQSFIPILCNLMETSFSKGWKRILCSTVGALWNLSSHSARNKELICDHNGALQILISCLSEREIELIKHATGVLHYVSELLVRDFFAHRDVVETFDLIPQLISILIAVRSPNTVLNTMAIISKLIRSEHYRRLVCDNENVFLRLQKLRNATDKAICQASSRLLTKISLQEPCSTTINASFKHVVASTPRCRNPRSRLSKLRRQRPDSLMLLRSQDLISPTSHDLSELYATIRKKHAKRTLNRSYGEFEESPCAELLEEEVKKVLESENADLTANPRIMTSDYVSLSEIQEQSPPANTTKKSPLRFLSKVLRFKR